MGIGLEYVAGPVVVNVCNARIMMTFASGIVHVLRCHGRNFAQAMTAPRVMSA